MSIKTDLTEEARRFKAKNLRYKKAIPAVMNLENIRDTIDQIGEVASDIRWWCTDGDETMLDELIGDEEEAFELKMAFSSLDADCYRFSEDLQNEWIPEFFDDFFGGIADRNDAMMGFDSYEGDYFGLRDYETEYAQQECRERLKRHTKDEIIEAYRICFRVAISFVAIQARYDSLKSYIDILKGANTGLIAQVKQIEDIYERVEGSKWEYADWRDRKEFIRLVDSMPAETWIQ